jgi:hypothetical protein
MELVFATAKDLAVGDLVMIEYRPKEWTVVTVRKVYISEDKQKGTKTELANVEYDFNFSGSPSVGVWTKEPLTELPRAPPGALVGARFPKRIK